MQNPKRPRITREDTSENINKFISDFVSDKIVRYQDQYEQLYNQNIMLRQKYTKLLTQIHQYDAINVNIRPQTIDHLDSNIPDDSLDPDTDTHHTVLTMYAKLPEEEQIRFLNNLSWNDIIAASFNLAEKGNKAQILRYNEVVASQTFPKIIVDPPLTKPDPILLVHQSYYAYFDDVNDEYRSLQNTLATINTDTQTKDHIILLPSQWIIDFLKVFDTHNKNPNILYPTSQSFQNIFYLTLQINQVINTQNTLPVVKSSLKQYTPDIHYHIMRFISTLTSVLFTPLPDATSLFPPTVFSDMHLFCHFAVMLNQIDDQSQTPFTYEAFLKGEYDILQNSKSRVQLQVMVTKAILFLKECLDNSHRFYLVNNRIYLRYIATNTSNDTSIQLRPTPVPDEVVKVLRPLILNNIHNYKKRYQGLVYQHNENFQFSVIDLSPIGQLLNHDQTAINEFTALYKKYGTDMPISLVDDINMMSCIHNLFSVLQQAAWAIYLSVPTNKWLKDIVPNVLNKAIYLNTVNKGVIYGSTGEILPGVYIRHILSDYTLFSDSSDFRDTSAFNENFFNRNHRTDRVSFFNLFRTYSRLVPPIKDISSMTKIRNISHKTMHQFYISTLKNRSSIRYSLLNIFLQTREKKLIRKQELQVMNYLKDNSIVTAESTPLKLTIDVFASYQDKDLGDYNFYINPCTYRTLKVIERLKSDKESSNKSIHHPPAQSKVFEEIALENISTPGLTQSRIFNNNDD